MEPDKTSSEQGDRPRRVIKRYSNRKLYDTRDSRYVTLQQIGEMVRAGEEVQIIDNATKEDKTEVTLALILSDNLRAEPRSVPLAALRDLIQERGTKLLETLREGPIGRLIPSKDGAAEAKKEPEPEPPPPPPEPPPAPAPSRSRFGELVESSRQTLEEWQHSLEERFKGVDERIRGAPVRDLEAEIASLRDRVRVLEEKLGVTPPQNGKN